MADGPECGCAHKCNTCKCEGNGTKEKGPTFESKWFNPRFSLPLIGIMGENRFYYSGLLHARMIALEKYFNQGTSIEREKLLAQYNDATPGFEARTREAVAPGAFKKCDIAAWKKFIARYFETYPEGVAPASGKSAKSVVRAFGRYLKMCREIEELDANADFAAWDFVRKFDWGGTTAYILREVGGGRNNGADVRNLLTQSKIKEAKIITRLQKDFDQLAKKLSNDEFLGSIIRKEDFSNVSALLAEAQKKMDVRDFKKNLNLHLTVAEIRWEVVEARLLISQLEVSIERGETESLGPAIDEAVRRLESAHRMYVDTSKWLSKSDLARMESEMAGAWERYRVEEERMGKIILGLEQKK